MKHLKFNTFLLTLLLSMAGITAAAHDIAVENEGKIIYYIWTNNNTELAVSYQGSSYYSYSNRYSGNVVIPESVTYNGAAYPVTSIGNSAFSGCSGLTSVTIGNSVTSIGEYAFSFCSGLTSVTISDLAAWCSIIFTDLSSNPLNYAHHLYMNGEEVKDLIIPNTVTNICSYSFYGCSGLTSVTIPSSVTTIGGYAFRNCSGLTSVTIPNSVTSIGDYAFEECSSLTSVTIPNSVTSIGNSAFQGCSGLTSVTIPNSVTSIGSSAFGWCKGLTSMTIPNSVTSIGGAAFSHCSGLTSVTIPNSVTSIGKRAFEYCYSLTDVFCYAENVPTTEADAFKSASISSATLHVPAASLSSYQTTEPWSGFGTIVALSNQCATPTIAFANGKLTFECETEDVEYVYSFSSDAFRTSSGSDIPLAGVLHVSVYATKDGCADSDVATIDINLSDMLGDANGDGEITIADITTLINTILGNGNADNARMKK